MKSSKIMDRKNHWVDNNKEIGLDPEMREEWDEPY